MIALFSLILFSSALVTTAFVVGETLLPAMPRIIGLLTTGNDPTLGFATAHPPYLNRRARMRHTGSIGAGLTLAARYPASPQRVAA